MIIKRKIVNSMKKERLLLITYEHNGEKYTDKLCPNELLITREWLDRVVSVVVIDESTTESEREAKELLTQYLKSHEKN